ncbi:MAG: GerW family sporulation protein [Bacilli bacterium]|jgi:sporulation protein YtfJ|nr:GerW family sporulation protein [Bacillota bacterium]NLM31337.1 sporulation protein YtfJ [Acholeplasmataceae bacterium]HOA78998.1 GerW family sporulation protein [Bacilli bacterium]HPZ27735.1 GerW family sporulation protein [Bacilli bacterium]
MEHPISELFKISLNCIKDMIDVNTIVGEAIKIDDKTSIIPVSKVKCAFATGGCEQKNVKTTEERDYPFGGATGGTLTLTPMAFLVCGEDEVKLLHMAEHVHLYEKIIDQLPVTVSQIKDIFSANPKITNLEVIERTK